MLLDAPGMNVCPDSVASGAQACAVQTDSSDASLPSSGPPVPSASAEPRLLLRCALANSAHPMLGRFEICRANASLDASLVQTLASPHDKPQARAAEGQSLPLG